MTQPSRLSAHRAALSILVASISAWGIGSPALAQPPPSKPLISDEVASEVLIKTNPQGVFLSCTITHSSGSPQLDAQACALLKAKGDFKPAFDAKGRPIAGEYRTRIVWQSRNSQ